jgi:hypothetical protein
MSSAVMRGPDPRIHLPSKGIVTKMMDGRVKPGHDEMRSLRQANSR